jgi:regulatory protein YycI of two-component signal transduction system YycFG
MIEWSKMGAGHFIFIPAALLIGIVIGWIFGSRAAADAYRVELKRREERAKRESIRQAS